MDYVGVFMNRIEMKNKAKEVLKGKVFFSFVVVLLFGLVMGLPDMLIPISGSGERAFAAIGSLFAAVLGIFLIPVRFGVVQYFHDISNGREGRIDDFLTPYKEKFWEEMIKARLIASIYTVLGLICFIIPGIYMAFKYSQIEYCFLDNKQIKYKEAMDKSAQIMKNNKMELFVLSLSFIGWMLLIPLTLGILAIYVAPYLEATMLQFYYAKSGTLPSSQPEVVVIEDISSTKEEKKEDSDFWK